MESDIKQQTQYAPDLRMTPIPSLFILLATYWFIHSCDSFDS